MSPRAQALSALGVAALAPLFLNPGGLALHNMVLAAAYVVMALGLNIVIGYAGLLDLGYAAFFAIGSYTYAMLASNQFNIHLSFWMVLFIAAGAVHERRLRRPARPTPRPRSR